MLCAYTRPKYQVSVYRTFGTLVLSNRWKFISHTLGPGKETANHQNILTHKRSGTRASRGAAPSTTSASRGNISVPRASGGPSVGDGSVTGYHSFKSWKLSPLLYQSTGRYWKIKTRFLYI